MVSSAGMSAAYGGYQHARKLDNEIQSSDIQNQQAQTGLEADTAWGNTIPVLQQMLQPGASPMPGAGAPPPMGGMPQQAGPAPQAPPPGQPSQPMQMAGGPPQQRGPQPQMLGAPPPPDDPTWSVGARQQGASPPPQPGGGMPPPGPPQQAPQPMRQQGGQQPQQQGQLDLHTIMAAVVKANPGAKPAVIAAAVAKALPLMTAQSQMDYKKLMVQLGATREQGRNDRNDATLGSREDIAAANNETRTGIATGNQATRRDIATGNQESRERVGADRNAAAGQRVETLEQGRNARSGALEEGRNTRNAATLESRGTIAGNKEQGLNDRQATRNEFLSQRIKLQSDNLERQLKRDSRLEDNARNRQTLKLMEDENNAEFKRSQQKIAAQNVFAPNKSKEKLTQDAETAYQNARQRIEQYRTSMGGGTAAAPQGGEQPPPEALKELKEGHVTTFGNGQKWTLQGGKPVRVPGPQSSLSPVNEQFPGAGTDNPMDQLRTRHFQRQRRDAGPAIG